MEILDQAKVKERLKPGSKEFQDLIAKYPLHIISLLALYFNFIGFPERGMSLLISALSKELKEWELYDKLVFLAIKAGKPAEAEKKLLEAQALFPDNPQVYGSLGKLYFLEKKFTPAKDLLGKSLKLNPEDGFSYLFLALSRLALFSEENRINCADFPEVSKTQEEVRKFKELNPELVADDFLEGENLLAQGNYTEAFEYFQENLNSYLNKKIELTRFHKLFFSFYFEPEGLDLEELKSYIYELERKLKYSSSSVEKFNHLGCSYLLFFINLVKSAEEQLRKALNLDPEFEAAQKSLGFLERKKKEILFLINSIKS